MDKDGKYDKVMSTYDFSSEGASMDMVLAAGLSIWPDMKPTTVSLQN